jgi:PPOX class probable F420-dependent enzyme
VSRRDQITMSDAELHRFLASARTIILVSNGPRGMPHPMPMWFALDPDGAVRMATYRTSQKVRNLERDPRVALLVESGEEYGKLRGAVLYGECELIHDRELAIDTLIEAAATRREDAAASMADPEVRKGMERTAAKRVVIRVRPERTVTWDHSKLGGTY